MCKTKNQVVAEYELEDDSKPMGISEYRLAECLPEKLQRTCRLLRSWRVNWVGALKGSPESGTSPAIWGRARSLAVIRRLS